MKTVKLSELTTMKMVTGNEKKYNVVIINGIRKEWVGIGWIGEGKASIEDKRKYPTAID